MDIKIIIAMVTAAVGVIVWLVRMEGRINGHDDAITSMRADLHYIRTRIDKALEE